jgi:hypothetical protein
VADLTGDGVPDLLKVVAEGEVRVLPGLGDGTFLPGSLVAVPELDATPLATGDFDRDGMQDLAGRAATGVPRVLVQRMRRHVPVGAPAGQPLEGDAHALLVADLDLDGLPDLAATTSTAAVLHDTLGPFIDLGLAQPWGADTPLLALSGTPAAGGKVHGGVTIAASAVPGALFIGLTPAWAPFHGGVLVPAPDFALPLLAPPGIAAEWPPGIPAGTPLYAQAVLAIGGGQTLNSNALVILAE